MAKTLKVAPPRHYTDLVYSPDDNGWYAHEYDFARKATRTSLKIYPTRDDLLRALSSGRHRWQKWE